MKLNKIFSAIFASALLFSGCVKDMPTDSFENIKLDQTFLTIPETGGSAVLTVTSTEPWKFVINESWPQVLSFSKGADGKTIKAKHDYYGTLTNWADVDASNTKDSWLKVEGTYYTTKDGATIASEIPAGETKITFKADPSKAGREITLALVCGSSKQHFVVRQGSIAPEDATCNEVINGPDGKTYRVRGVCTSIVNTTYGNWYLKDDSHKTDNTIYIYGTLNANGEEKKFSEWGLEVGDVVYVEGPKTTYGTTVELVNVTVLDIEKSLLKVVTESATYAKEGDDFEVKVAFKGRNVDYSIPEEYKDWIQVTGISSKEGIPTKLEQNPADTALVAVKILPNAGPTRAGAINFSSTLVNDESGKESKTEMAYEFTQDGDVIDVTVAEFLAAPEDKYKQYRVSGFIRSISASSQYHNADITIAGALGETVLLYRTVTTEGNIEDLGLQENDYITVIGTRSSYKGTPQMAQGGVYVSHVRYTPATVAEFLAAAEDDTQYLVSGEISSIKEVSEGYNNANINIKDETGEVYIYRVTVLDKDKYNITQLNLEVGGKIIVAGKKGSYKGSPQMAQGGIVVKYEAPAGGGDEPENPTPDDAKYIKVSAAPTDWTGKYLIVFGTEAHATISGKDLAKTADVTISDGSIASATAVDAAAVTVTKNEAGDKYVMTLPSGSYFGMAHNSCASSDSPFALEFEYTEGGIKISGDVAGKTGKYYLYSNKNNGDFYRCYVDKTGSSGYSLPELYKYTDK